jgi:hypothetical protein
LFRAGIDLLRPEDAIPFVKALNPDQPGTDTASQAIRDGLDVDVRLNEQFFEQLVDTTGARELHAAEAAGVLQVDELGFSPLQLVRAIVREGHGLDSLSVIPHAYGAFMEEIGALVYRDDTAYPLFDDTARGLAERLIGGGEVATGSVPPRQGQLAGHFVSEVAALEAMPMDEVLAIRAELQPELAPLRAGIIELGQRMSAAPWDADFKREANEMFAARVRPELDNLAEIADQKSILPTFTRQIRRGGVPAAAGSAVLALGFTAASVVPEIAAALMSVVAPTSALAAAVIREVTHRYELDKLTHQNQFLFLYKLAVHEAG